MSCYNLASTATRRNKPLGWQGISIIQDRALAHRLYGWQTRRVGLTQKAEFKRQKCKGRWRVGELKRMRHRTIKNRFRLQVHGCHKLSGCRHCETAPIDVQKRKTPVSEKSLAAGVNLAQGYNNGTGVMQIAYEQPEGGECRATSTPHTIYAS